MFIYFLIYSIVKYLVIYGKEYMWNSNKTYYIL